MNVTALVTFFLITITISVLSTYIAGKEKLDTVEGYFLGGRHLNWFLVGGSLFLSNISAIAMIGETESAYLSNMSIMMYGFSAIVAMVIIAEFILPVYLRQGVTTTPEFLESRYGATVGKLVSFLFIASYTINLMPPVLYTGAVIFNGMFNVDEILGVSEWAAIWILVWSIGIVGSAYAVFGGLKAISASDALNGVGLVLGGLLVPYFGLTYVGNGSLGEGFEHIITNFPSHLNSLGKPTDMVPWTTLFTGILLINLNYWGAEQYILQRTLGAKSLTEGQKGMMFGASFKFIAPLITVFPGVIALAALPSLDSSAEAYPQLIALVMPEYLIGIIAAIMFGASLTTFNSGLNSTSTIALLNLYKPMQESRGHKVEDASIIVLGKKLQVVLAILAMTIAPFIGLVEGGFFAYIIKVGSIFSFPIFAVVFMSMVNSRVPTSGVITGLVFYLTTFGYSQFFDDFGVHFLHIAAILFLCTIVIMYLFSIFSPSEKNKKKVVKSAVDLTPWPKRYYAYFSLISIMLITIYWLSPFGIAQW